MTEKAIRIAKKLISEHKDKIPFQNLGKNLNPCSKSEAYIAQDYFHKMAGRGELGGYKIALSSKVQQEHHKINEPLFGALFKSEIFFSPKVINFLKSSLRQICPSEVIYSSRQSSTSHYSLQAANRQPGFRLKDS